MTFSQRVLDNFVQIFSKNGVNLSNELQSYADSKEIFNVYNVINKYTVKSICGWYDFYFCSFLLKRCFYLLAQPLYKKFYF